MLKTKHKSVTIRFFFQDTKFEKKLDPFCHKKLSQGKEKKCNTD